MMQCLHWVRPYAVRARTRLEKIPALLVLCGLLTSSSAVPAATLSVDYDYIWPGTNKLSEEGALDWGHWGLVNEFSYNHKHGVAQQITYSFITDVIDYPDWNGPFVLDYRYGGFVDFSWTDGMPSRVIEDTWNAISIYGDRLQPDNNPTGFRIQCAADKSPKTLRIYLAGGGGKETSFTARLSGATNYTHVWSDGYGGDRVYTLDFQAGPISDLMSNLLQHSHAAFWDLHLDVIAHLDPGASGQGDTHQAQLHESPHGAYPPPRLGPRLCSQRTLSVPGSRGNIRPEARQARKLIARRARPVMLRKAPK